VENRKQQIWFLQPIKDSDRQGDRNPRVSLKAKVIQASSQLNPDRGKIFQFSGQQLPISKFGQDNLPKILRFGARLKLTPTLNISQDCAGENPAISNFSTFNSLGIPFCNSTPAVNPVPLVFRFGEVKSTHEPQVNIFTPANQRENTGLAPLSFPGNSGSAAAGEIRHGEEPTTAMNSSSNLGGNPGLAHIRYPSAGDSGDDTTDYAPPVLEQLSRALMNYQMSYLQRKLSNIWSAHLMDLGPAEQQHCLHSYISQSLSHYTTGLRSHSSPE